MAGEDYSIKTKVEADVTNFEKGMNKAEKSLKGFSNNLADNINRLGKKGLVGSIANVTLAMSGLTKSLSTVIKFAKDVGKTINECTEAYKAQAIAERALDTAISNNPFVTGESAKALKEFASEMQKVSNYGDEELIPMMTNLVSLGRTESETMQIMSVAMDMSAGMGISLDTAITQLNATLNGNIGRLGQQNAELKGLTEEELKQGKAIEILGEKFKGLSGATADTSKQLQNIKGDFKEALGQFTLPSSDMWNKFWTGFYERGIEVIGKINAYIDAQTIGKKLASEYVKQIKAISTEKVYNPETGIYDVRDLGARVKYIREALKVLSDEELEALNNYLSSQRRLNDEEQQLLNRIKAEQDSRYQGSINAKKEAEDKKKQADAEAQITAELQKQEEVEKKKTDWASKLLDQRIEMLETERDRAMQFAEEEGQETYTIWREYNEKILELKLERLEKEKEKALEEEGLTAEDKVKVEEYYSGETKKIYDELGDYKKKKGKEEAKDEKSKLAVMVEYAQQYAQKIKQIFSKVVSTIKNVFSGVVNIFGKLFEFNIDDALNAILKWEDNILTFFVETLPKLPQFFASAVQSIVTLIQNVLSLIDFDALSNILDSILDTVLSLITTVAKFVSENAGKLADGFTKLIQTVISGLNEWIQSGGWRELLNAILSIQKAIEKVVTDNIESIVDTIISMLPDLIDTLIASIVSASQTLAKLIKPILKLVVKLIEAIIEVAFSDEVLDASMEVITSFVEAIIEVVIEMLPKILPKLIAKVIKFIVSSFPKMVVAIVKGLVQAFAKTNWGQVIKDIFTGFIDAIKELFGIHSPSTLFEEFGLNMIDGLVNGLKGIAEAVNIILEPLANLVNNVFKTIGDTITNSIKVSFDGLKDVLDSIGNIITNLTDISFKGFKDIIDSSGNVIVNLTNSATDLVKALKDLIKEVNNATSALGFGGGSGGGGGILDWVNPVTSPLSPWNWFADGTQSASRGLAVVGEAGPELVRFNGGEQVINNRNTQKLLADSGKGGNNFNVTFNNLQDTSAFAMMKQLKQYQRELAFNGIL